MPEKLVMLVFPRLALLAIISLPEGSQRWKHEKAKQGNNPTFDKNSTTIMKAAPNKTHSLTYHS